MIDEHEVMISFSIDKQRDKMNAEWMSRPVDSFKNKTKDQPLALVLTSMEQALTFAYRLKRKLLNGPILGGAYIINEINKLTKDWGVSCCILSMHHKGNGDMVFSQIKEILDSQNVPYDITFSENNGQAPPNGIFYSIKDGKLKVLVGDY